MKIFNHLRPGILATFFLLPVLLLLPMTAAALTPDDLIVVYNDGVPESRKVADYYAQKRDIPPDNLVGVKVPDWEDLTRQEYDQQLVPPVREKVLELRRAWKNPAVVLVYGIPLRVGAVPLTEAEKELQGLVRAQGQQAASQTWAKLQELQGMLTNLPNQPSASGGSPAVKDILKLSGDLVPRASRLLTMPREPELPAATRTRIAALLVELSGKAPQVEGKAGPKEKEGDLHHLEPLPEGSPAPPASLQSGASLAEHASFLAEKMRGSGGLLGELRFWEHLNGVYGQPRTGAAVDSELTLLMAENFPKVSWLPNPLNLRFDHNPGMQKFRRAVVMVGRLDGPTPEIACRLVDDALEAEKNGLTGTCYLDARGLKGEGRVGGYDWFDAHLVHLAQIMKTQSTMKAVLDQNPALLPPGSCTQAALYCGWYSLAKYVASCTWQKGAVAYHVASAEATTLRRPGSQVWCRRMLQEGVAATLGPVSEPYLMAFPLPDDFFPLLMAGELSLLEVYFRTLPQLSWQMILIGDPLYTPFKKNPAWRSPAKPTGASPAQ
jgi:uncharacterized protein (TIGR03790 family)